MAGSTQKLLADFREQFPELADAPDSVATQWLDIAGDIHSASDHALLWCAAHLVAVDQAEGRRVDSGAGEVEEEQIGPKRVRYRAQAKDDRDTFFTRTSYGRMFLQLERRAPAVAMAVRVYG